MSRDIRVVAAVIVSDGDPPQVLACRRIGPEALAGLWEFPGGKVEPGETLEAALTREIDEELGVGVEIAGRLGGPWPMIGGSGTWQPFVARIISGSPRLVDHDQMRWLTAAELDSVEWLASDQPVMGEVAQLLTR